MSRISYARVFTQLAEQAADRIAVVCEGRSITRGELERRSNRLARAFLERGVE